MKSEIKNAQFLADGKLFRILSGEIDYFRSMPAPAPVITHVAREATLRMTVHIRGRHTGYGVFCANLRTLFSRLVSAVPV